MRALLEAQPWCIYCGGVHAATTVDHMPPIVIFDLRQRPRGLEFSACEPCNSGSRHAEQVVGLMSRMYPEPPNEAARRDIGRLMHEVANNHRGLLEEMVPTLAQRTAFLRQHTDLPAGTAPLNARGPLLGKAMNTFAAKLALAMHFEMTKAIVSPGGVIAARWYPNHQVYRGGIPDVLLKLVGDPGTLVQGKRNVGNQFLYAGAHTPDGRQSVFVAQFRESFAVAGIVYDGPEAPDVEGFPILRPGFLRSDNAAPGALVPPSAGS